ncbi:MAG: hypothetical protein AAF570_05480 [Bacteroidota bacterium]
MRTYQSVRAISQPAEDKLFFAGDLYTDGKEDRSMVQVATESARKAVLSLVGEI